ncbi:hypothetical protein [Streptomyces sp. NBC_00690]|uniref:hypothetical protein n=1 Tax=Streptomyces sp. NBC_00690 TaxID=2975808 RepID=UPI002E2E3087|nr:hypothetical protein [Streptomyces sp. NBC_00690]
MDLITRPRLIAALAASALVALGVGAPSATALPQSTRSLVVQWASADPSPRPFGYGTLTVGGTYTCTGPTGTTMPVDFSGFQIMPLAMPAGSGTLPCGPGVVDAPWQLTSFPNPEVHYGYTSVMVTYDGSNLSTGEFTA